MTADALTELRPGCKVNLYLRIVRRREDGMHELETLFFPLPTPGDVLRVRQLPDSSPPGLRFSCSVPELEGPQNLVVQAYEAFVASGGLPLSLEAHLEKHVPAGAGLGGGSADAAAMLRHCNMLAQEQGQALEHDVLAELARGLGADVPFFLQDAPAFATGVGEKLRPAPEVAQWLSGWHVLLCMPEVHISTGWAYGAWDDKQDSARLTAFETQAIDAFCLEGLALYNSFEAVVLEAWPQLRSIKVFLLRNGARGALLSGSGASVFGLFREHAAAQTAGQELAAQGVTSVCIQLAQGA